MISKVSCPSYLMYSRPGTIQLLPGTLREMQDCRKAQEAQPAARSIALAPAHRCDDTFQRRVDHHHHHRPSIRALLQTPSPTLSLSSLPPITARFYIYSMTLRLSHHHATPPAQLSAPLLPILLRTLYHFSPAYRTRLPTFFLPEIQRRSYEGHTRSKADPFWLAYTIQGLRCYRRFRWWPCWFGCQVDEGGRNRIGGANIPGKLFVIIVRRGYWDSQLAPPRSAGGLSRFVASSPLRGGPISSLSLPGRASYGLSVSMIVTHNPRGLPRRRATS